MLADHAADAATQDLLAFIEAAPTPYHAATKITKLPAETTLKLGKFVEGGS